MRSRLAAILIALCVGGLTGAPARADDRVERMLLLLRQQPQGMDGKTWRSQRREAVRELGRLRARRAVPALLKIVSSERLDAILEFAITALGEIGDARARPALRRLEGDTSLDRFVRDAASRALRKIGGQAQPRPRPRPKIRPRPRPKIRPRPKPKQPKQPQQPAPLKTKRPARRDPSRAFGDLPPVTGAPGRGVLFRARWWDLAAGAADVRWDGQVEGTRVGLALSSRLVMQEERPGVGLSVDAAADLGLRLTNAPGDDATWGLTHALQVNPEVRLYPFRQAVPLLFAQLSGGAGYGLALTARPGADDRLAVAGNLSVGLGPGYGRVVDAGPVLRLKRVRDVLEQAGLLSGPVPAAVASELMYAWYALRHRLGSHARLGHTLRILHRAKLLRRAPGAAVTYRLIRALDDPQLDWRREGFMVRLGYGYARTLIKNAADSNMAFLYTTGEYHRQLGSLHAFDAGLRFFYQHVGDPDFYGVTFSAAYQYYLYTENLDPVGALSAGLDGGVSNQPGAAFADAGLGYRFLVKGGYSHHFSRGARVSASLGAGIDTGSPLVMFTLEARYGFSRGSYLGAPGE